MADLPPDDVNDDPESRFLVELWDLLGEALEISTAEDVMSRLNEVLAHCEAAVALLQRGPQ